MLIGCKNNENHFVKSDNYYWICHRQFYGIDECGNVDGTNIFLYSFKNNDSINIYKYVPCKKTYTVCFPNSYWKQINDSTIKIGSIIYNYRFLNDSCFTMRNFMIDSNSMLYEIDTMRLIKSKITINKDSIILNKRMFTL